jgi:O-antigen ligase
MRAPQATTKRQTRDFRVLAGFVALLFLCGGGARADLASLVIIRPVAVLLAAWWAIRLTREQIAADRWFFAFSGATFALALLHIVPLPPVLWHTLPGHELIQRIDSVTALGSVWRPLTIAPDAAHNAFWSLFVPLAAGLGMVHLDSAGRRAMVPVILALAGVGLLLSLLQALAPSASMLWFYRITNSDSPVGLFANRNHNAVFLAAMIPLAAAWSIGLAEERFTALKRAAAVGGALLIVVIILISGSRAGVIGLAAALVGSAFLLPWAVKLPATKRRPSAFDRVGGVRMAALAAAVILVPVVLLLIGSRLGDTGAVGRLTDGATGDFRPDIWRATLALIPRYLPLGSGLGSFVETYLVGEPPRLMMEQYVNHAHNDFLEIALTLGLPGALLVIASLLFIGKRAWSVWRRPVAQGGGVRMARAASFALAVLIGASVADYPLRTPSLAAAAVIFLFVLSSRGRSMLAGR